MQDYDVLNYPAFLYQKYGLKGSVGYAFILLARECVNQDYCKVTNRELKKRLLVSDRTVVRYIKNLEEIGLIRCEYKSSGDDSGRTGIYERKLYVNLSNPDVADYMKSLKSNESHKV